MSSTVAVDGTVLSFARAHDDVDDLLAMDLSRCTADAMLESWRELERLRNRLAAVEHRFVVEAERSGLPFEHGARDVAAFVRGLLRVHPSEARGRVHAADAAAGRMTLTGEPTLPPFSEVAAAQASGTISPRHAHVVVSAVDSLSQELQVEHGERLERELVGYAETFDPFELGKVALRMTLLLDQDGKAPAEDERRARRCLTVNRRPDGSASITGEATVELAERLVAVLDATAAPKPADDGTPDPRTAGQRNHDGLLDALHLLQCAEVVPHVGGISTTVLLTMSVDAWQSGRGYATTGHGAVISASDATRIAGGDARVMTVEFDKAGAVTGWTDARRLFTETQRLVMASRDGGCSFPGCDVPPAWCQAHHVVEWARGGPTTVDNGALVCGYHHREHENQGWRSLMIDQKPAWIPPPWIDPDQMPRFNRLHQRR